MPLALSRPPQRRQPHRRQLTAPTTQETAPLTSSRRRTLRGRLHYACRAAWERAGTTTAARHGAIGTRGFCARVVFGAQIVEYENGVDYAARLSKDAYYNGYTAIPLGNAPWSVRKRWANGALKGARGGGTKKGHRKGEGRQGAR